jgi:hypothetical protein
MNWQLLSINNKTIVSFFDFYNNTKHYNLPFIWDKNLEAKLLNVPDIII